MPHVSFLSRAARRIAPFALMLTCSAGIASAADAPRAPQPLDRAARAAVLDSLGAQVMRNYVDADTARLIVERLKARQRAGAYDTLASPLHFAEVVTTDLRGVNGDLHLSLRWDPEGAGGNGGGPVIVRRFGPGPDGGAPGAGGGANGGPGSPVIVTGPPRAGGAPNPGGGPVVVMGPPRVDGGGPASGPPSAEDSVAIAHAPWARDMARNNFGLTHAEVLPGNVGYLEITGFMEGPGSDEAIVSALRFLEHTDAMILDVRRNHGGSGHMSHLLFSHFLPATPVATLRVTSRAPRESFEMQSLAEVPGPRRPDVPLYVLTSRETGSAGEEFSFVLHNLKRATLVGDRTAGAGHMVGLFGLPDGFVAGVSITRVSDPRTGLEWERIGVQPDVRVDPEQALAVAHVAALRGLAAATRDDARRGALEMQAEWLEAKDRTTAVAAARLTAIAGSYEGDRVISVRNGKLFYGRGTFTPQELVPLGNDRFAMAGEARFIFAPGSPAPSVTIERGDGTRSVCPRIRSTN